jgi:DNA-binding NarL/FixJ family response regulator
LGDAAFAAAVAVGRRLPPADAVAEALALADDLAAGTGTDSTASASSPTAEPGSRVAPIVLSPREREVLRLVADGLSDREIAEALFVGAGTVRTHLANAFGKLGVGSRTAAVAAARRRGIL